MQCFDSEVAQIEFEIRSFVKHYKALVKSKVGTMKKTDKVLDKEMKGLDGIRNRRNEMLELRTKILSTRRAASTAT